MYLARSKFWVDRSQALGDKAQGALLRQWNGRAQIETEFISRVLRSLWRNCRTGNDVTLVVLPLQPTCLPPAPVGALLGV